MLSLIATLQILCYLIVRNLLFLRPQSFRILRLSRFRALLPRCFRFCGVVHVPLQGINDIYIIYRIVNGLSRDA